MIPAHKEKTTLRHFFKQFTREDQFFILLVVLQLVPVWAFAYFPSQDGPMHLEVATLLRNYNLPEFFHFKEYFGINPHLDPNWLIHLVMAGLLQWLPPLIVEKLIISGYLLLLPLAARYALRGVRPAATWAAVLFLPFVCNFSLHMGFYNFIYSLVLFFTVVGYWLHHRNHFGLRQGALFAGLWAALYFCHPVSLVMAYLTVGMLAIWDSLTMDKVPVKFYAARLMPQRLVRRLALLAMVCFPTIVLALTYIHRHAAQTQVHLPVKVLIGRLLVLYGVVSYGSMECWVGAALVVFLAGMTGWLLWRRWRRRQLNPWDSWLVVAVLSLGLYFCVPDEFWGGGYVTDRLMLFSFFALILWCGAELSGAKAHRIAQATAASLALLLLGMRWASYAQLNSQIREYLSVQPMLQSGRMLLPLAYAKWGLKPDGSQVSIRVKPFGHVASYFTITRKVVDLANWSAHTGYFPIVYRDGRDPYKYIGKIERDPPTVSFITYPGRTGGAVDYVLLWGLRPGDQQDPRTQIVLKELAAAYEPIYTSLPRGLAVLYQRKGR